MPTLVPVAGITTLTGRKNKGKVVYEQALGFCFALWGLEPESHARSTVLPIKLKQKKSGDPNQRPRGADQSLKVRPRSSRVPGSCTNLYNNWIRKDALEQSTSLVGNGFSGTRLTCRGRAANVRCTRSGQTKV